MENHKALMTAYAKSMPIIHPASNADYTEQKNNFLKMALTSIEKAIRQTQIYLTKGFSVSAVASFLKKDGFNPRQIDVMVRWAILLRNQNVRIIKKLF